MHVFRPSSLVAILALAAILDANAEVLTHWYTDKDTRPAGEGIGSGGKVVLGQPGSAHEPGAWAPVAPVDLNTTTSLTIRARLTFNKPPAPKSNSQFRFALLAATNSVAAFPDRTDLRGWVLSSGMLDGRWCTELWERTAAASFPCSAAGSRPAGKVDAPAADQPVSMRFVMTVTRRGPRVFDINGFWGTHPFTFAAVQGHFDAANVRAVAFLNGKGTGVDELTLERVEVDAP